MQLSHSVSRLSATFDDPNLIGTAGLVPALGLADRVGLRALVGRHVQVAGTAGANPGAKVTSLVAGMAAGSDSIDAMDLLRHGGTDQVFTDWRAPSTLGTFLRAFTFGHVRQLDAVAARTLVGLAETTPLLTGIDTDCVIDVDDTIKAVFGAGKQGAQFGYTKIRGLNAQLATISTAGRAPVIAATRLRRGAVFSAHGAVRMIRDAIATARRAGATDRILVRADAAYCHSEVIAAVRRSGARFAMAISQDARVKPAIGSIDPDAWVRIEYPWAIPDPDTGELVSAAELAEIPYTAFTSTNTPVTARLIVRRIPERNTSKQQDPLFAAYRYHCVFTDQTDELVSAEARYRGHAIIEQVIADLKASALANLPSGTFAANAAWLVCAAIAFNLTRALGTLAGDPFTTAETATIRARLINLPARTARSARRLHLHLPRDWPWAPAWQQLWTAAMTT